MTTMGLILALALAAHSHCGAQQAPPAPAAPALGGVFEVEAFGAKADGVTDCTKAIQAAIDKAAEKGGQVRLAAGKYLVCGSLAVKPGVAVVGVAVAPLYIKPLLGSVVLATGGRDKEDGPALFEMGDSSTVQGLTVYYPEQKPTAIRPYSWTFHLQGGDNTVESVTLINSYNAIRVGPEGNVRHRIRSVYGCALRRGILIDACSDIGRVENVQFHCHWWSDPSVGGAWEPVFEYMWKNLEAFVFGRTDWEFVTNNFVFPTNIGYRFIETKAGACNGQFSGNGSDASQVAVQVDQVQPMGLLITNGQFVSFNGTNPRGLVVSETCTGQVRLVNCNYWGSFRTVADLRGRSFVGFTGCYFSGWDAKGEGLPAIDARSGRLQVQGSSFVGKLGIRLGAGVRHAIITGNNGSNGVQIEDPAQKAIIRDNEPYPSPPAASRAYSIELGLGDSDEYLTGSWNGPEPSGSGPGGAKGHRWTMAQAGLRLPVLPDTDYDLTLWISAPKPDPTGVVGVVGGESVKLDKAGTQELKFRIPKALTAGKAEAELKITVKGWVPGKTATGSDDRTLGIQVFKAQMTAR